MEDMNLSRTAEAVFLYLLDVDGQCPITIEDIAENCAIECRGTIFNILRRLRKCGMLEVIQRSDGKYYETRLPWLMKGRGYGVYENYRCTV